MTAPVPVESAARSDAIDVLRGVAVLGILVLNIGSFAMPDPAYVSPYAYGDLGGANYVVWLGSHVFALGKFITIFSLLFGAGLVLRSDTGPGRFIRRQGVLLTIGLLHAYFLWSGDILVSYALVGLLVYPLRRLPPRWLAGIGTAAFLAGIVVQLGLVMLPFLADETPETVIAWFEPTSEEIDEELAAYRGPWTEQQSYRVEQTSASQAAILPFYSLPCTGGLMLIGIALARTGFFQGAWRRGLYVTTIVAGLGIGMPLIGLELWLGERFGHVMFWVGYVFSHLTDLAALPIALAYAAIVALSVRAPLGLIARPLANVGRTALSCYLGQTLICTTLFYGHGLGWFGDVSRVGQFGIVLAVWAIELTLATLWLRVFRVGPTEWVWRSATNLRFEPLWR